MTTYELYQKFSKINDHDPFSPHKITFYLALIVTEGEYTHQVDFQSYKLTKGKALFIAKNQIHHFGKKLEKTSGYVVIFSHLFVDQHYQMDQTYTVQRLFNYHIESPLVEYDIRSVTSLEKSVDALYKEATSLVDQHQPSILASLLNVVLLKAERAKEITTPLASSQRWVQLFRQFTLLLEQEYVTTRSSRHYSSKMFISYKLLNDIVKSLSGKTAKAFIDQFVTDEIRRSLISTSLTIKEISYIAGFDEPSNMVKFFKKNTGQTPSSYRKK